MMSLDKADVDFREDGRCLYCLVSGEIDHHTAAQIRTKIDSRIMENPPDKLIMDMSGVSFMDSSGLGLVLGRYTMASGCNIDFAIGETTPAVKRMFDMAGLERMIKYENIRNGDNYEKK